MTANFSNRERHTFHKVHVDGCLVTDDRTRADYIVTKVGVGSVVIELKGSDVRQACKQVFATIEHVECQPWLEARKGMLIVCSKYPAADTILQRAEQDARKSGYKLKIKCKRADYAIEEFL